MRQGEAMTSGNSIPLTWFSSTAYLGLVMRLGVRYFKFVTRCSPLFWDTTADVNKTRIILLYFHVHRTLSLNSITSNAAKSSSEHFEKKNKAVAHECCSLKCGTEASWLTSLSWPTHFVHDCSSTLQSHGTCLLVLSKLSPFNMGKWIHNDRRLGHSECLKS